MLGELEPDEADVVIVDLEAGLGTLLRPGAEQLDTAVVVAEPTVTSMDVARRVVERARTLGAARVLVVANRVNDEADEHRITDAVGVAPDVVIEDDPAVRRADLAGASLVEHAPDAPTVIALAALARRLAPQATRPT